MSASQADPEDIVGFPLRGMLPTPVPLSYRGLPTSERAGRGRAALRFWVMGFGPYMAWAYAMSPRLEWRSHLPDDYQGRLDDRELPGEVLRRRLRDVLEAEGWYREAFAPAA